MSLCCCVLCSAVRCTRYVLHTVAAMGCQRTPRSCNAFVNAVGACARLACHVDWAWRACANLSSTRPRVLTLQRQVMSLSVSVKASMFAIYSPAPPWCCKTHLCGECARPTRLKRFARNGRNAAELRLGTVQNRLAVVEARQSTRARIQRFECAFCSRRFHCFNHRAQGCCRRHAGQFPNCCGSKI